MPTTLAASARIHIGLIDVGRAMPNAFGGAGFAIFEPETRVICRRGGNFRIDGLDLTEPEQQVSLKLLLKALSELRGSTGVDFQLLSVAPRHHGFGSGTTLHLSIIESFCIEAQVNLSIEQKQRLSGRGGTSGVGINTFFLGGVVRDSGRPWSEVKVIGPSGTDSPLSLPSVSRHLNVPDNWQLYLATPGGSCISGVEEIKFFANNTPIPPDEVMATADAIDNFVIKGIEEENLNLLKSGLQSLGRVGFKAREIVNQSSAVRLFLADVNNSDYLAGGLSSFGPTIYIFAERDNSHALECLEKISAKHGVSVRSAQPVPIGRGFFVT